MLGSAVHEAVDFEESLHGREPQLGETCLIAWAHLVASLAADRIALREETPECLRAEAERLKRFDVA